MKHSLRELASIIRDCADAESSFFSVEDGTDTVNVTLKYDKPDDIFDPRYDSKLPLLNTEFLDRISNTLNMIPSKYKIDLTVRFSDPKEYSEQTLPDILRENIRLEVSKSSMEIHRRNQIATVLIIVGAISFAVMMLISNLWGRENMWKDLFFYIADIAATVTLYEALSILLLQQKEYRIHLNDLERRISSFSFDLGGDSKET